VLLAARAAYRTGSGLVTVGVTEPVYAVDAGQLPEATWMILPGDFGNITEDAVAIIHKEIKDYDAILLGPGLGLNNKTEKFVQAFISSFRNMNLQHIGFITEEKVVKSKDEMIQPKMVIDADALKCLAKIKEWWKLLSDDVVLTPHPGEMSILTGLSINEIQNDRIGIAKKYAQKWNKVVVLKGALTIVASSTGKICIIPVATSALAHAGTGDVLAGMVASLLGQGVSAYEASIAGSYLHAQAGMAAVPIVGSEASILAMDVIEQIGGVVGKLSEQK
jgi:NAD(P)H-hydrate epimerase